MAAFKIFFGSDVARWRQALILICLLAAGLAEGFGLATIMPVLVVSAGEGLGNQPEFAIQMLGFFEELGIPTTFTSLLIVMIAGLALREILTFLAITFVGFTIASLATNYRRSLINSYLGASWSYFTREPLGQLTYAASSFAQGAADAFQTSSRFIANLLRTIVYVCVIIVISGKLALVALVVGFFIVATLHFLVGVARKAAQKQATTAQLLSVNLTDVFSSIKSLKAMARHEHIHAMFKKTIKKLRRQLRRTVIASQGLINLQGLLETIAIGAGLYVAVVHWQVPILELGVIGGLMLQITKSLGRLQRLQQNVAVREVSYLRIHEIIGGAEEAREKNDGYVTPKIEKGIDFHNVSFAFGEKSIIEDSSIHIPSNSLTVIHGPSGQGKTTITDIVLGLYRPDSGSVLVDGTPLDDLDLVLWRKMVGYVPQELILHNGTIRLNITLGDPSFSDDDVWEALQIANAVEFVSQLDKGMYTPIGEQGLKLSGGQRQRISLARALVHRPKILILDEVTSALDPVSEQQICCQIQSMTRDKTIISITHRDAWLEIADVVVKIDNKKIKTQYKDRFVA